MASQAHDLSSGGVNAPRSDLPMPYFGERIASKPLPQFNVGGLLLPVNLRNARLPEGSAPFLAHPPSRKC